MPSPLLMPQGWRFAAGKRNTLILQKDLKRLREPHHSEPITEWVDATVSDYPDYLQAHMGMFKDIPMIGTVQAWSMLTEITGTDPLNSSTAQKLNQQQLMQFLEEVVNWQRGHS